MPDRHTLMARFLDENGWNGMHIVPLAADASFRRYFRVSGKDKQAILMDAPPPQEDVRPFAAMARNLRSLGLNAPEILAEDELNGLLLLEDFGDNTYTQIIAQGGDEQPLYELAIDVLIHIHQHLPGKSVPKGFGIYDDAMLLEEVSLLADWYMPAIFNSPPPPYVLDEFRQGWLSAFQILKTQPSVLVLKDYHVDNLMWLPNNNDLMICGLLDFQDAVTGPRPYDVMSLLEDARRDIAPQLVKSMLIRYRQAFPDIHWNDFQAAYAVLAAQRHAKVIGIFTRLWKRDCKPDYLTHIPRVWRLFEQALTHPALEHVASWLEKHIPKDKRGIPPCP